MYLVTGPSGEIHLVGARLCQGGDRRTATAGGAATRHIDGRKQAACVHLKPEEGGGRYENPVPKRFSYAYTVSGATGQP